MFTGRNTLRGDIVGEIISAAFGLHFCYIFKLSSTNPIV